MPSSATQTSSYECKVLNQALQEIGTIQPDLEQSVPTITNNINRTIKRSLDGVRLLPSDFGSVDPLIDRLKVYGTLNGVRKSLGVFMWTDASGERRSYGVTGNATMVDLGGVLDQPLGVPRGFLKGASISQAIHALAAEVGIVSFNLLNGGETLGDAVSFPGNTSRAGVMAQLANMAGWYSPFFSNDGALTTLAPPPITNDTSLVYASGDNIIANTIVESNDLLSAPNRWLVEVTGAEGGGLWAVYDIPADQPHSYANRGFYITVSLSVQGIDTVDKAYEAAKAAALADDSTYEWAEFDSIPSHDHDTFNLVKYLGVMYREQEWRLPLKAGEVMHHSLRRHYE